MMESWATSSYSVDTESDVELADLYETFYESFCSAASFDGTFDDSLDNTTSEEEQATASPPLYEGARVNRLQSIVLISQFSLKHGLSTKTLTELLQLLSALLPRETVLPKSVYLFKKEVTQLLPHAHLVQKHRYCKTCQSLLSESSVCGCENSQLDDFITIPIAPQLKRMMEGKIIRLCP